MSSDEVPDTKDPIEGCTRPAVIVLGAVIAPIAAGLALGVATIVGGAVLFGAFHVPPNVDPSLAILFVLALIAVLLSGILYVLSVRRCGWAAGEGRMWGYTLSRCSRRER